MTFFKLINCRSYEVMPLQKDLLNHMALMGEAAKRDTALAKSKVCIYFQVFNKYVVVVN